VERGYLLHVKTDKKFTSWVARPLVIKIMSERSGPEGYDRKGWSVAAGSAMGSSGRR